MSRRKSSSRRKKDGLGFFHISFRVVLIICALALVAGYLSILINPDTFFLPTLFGLYFIPIAIINFILLIIAAFRRSRSFWIPFIAMIPTLFISEHMFQPSRESSPWREGEIKILSYNVGLFRSGKNKMDEDDSREAIMKFIREADPDVICLQEYSVRDTLSIRRYFSNYPDIRHHLFRHSDGTWSGNVTASRFPISESGTAVFKGSTNMSLWCDIVYKNQQYRVFNNHLESNAISLTSLIKKIGRQDSDIRPEIDRIHGKIKASVSRRSHQTADILNNINTCKKPSIVCGDFNDTPVSYTFRQLCKGRKDSFSEAGSGFGATYSILWPMLRIDYVLYPERLKVLEHKTVRNTYSDHYPIITRAIPENEKNKR